MGALAKFGWWLAVIIALGGVVPGAARAQDAGAPCGRDANGYPLQCSRPDAGAYNESRCIVSATVEACLPYHQRYCQYNGIAAACRLFSLGRNCLGGDQQTCAYYMSLLRANNACNVAGTNKPVGGCGSSSSERRRAGVTASGHRPPRRSGR